MPDGSRLSDPERKALADSVSRTKQECQPGSYQCQYKVFHSRNNELLVGVDFIIQNQKTGACDQPVGGFQINEYDTSGTFVQTQPGL